MAFLSIAWGLITSRLAGPVASAVALLLALALLGSCVTQRSLQSRVDGLQAEIDAPNTGWRARLHQCHENEKGLRTSITTQNIALESLRKTGEAKLKESSRDLEIAQKATAKADAKIATFLKNTPKGIDVCARSLDARGKVLELLK